jgi:hypothetical protein
MELTTFKRTYLIGAVIVWVGLLFALAFTLSGTPYFTQVLPLLGGGIVWFVVIIPGALRAVR